MKLARIALAFLLPVIHSSASMLIHDYQFQNNLADSLGGPSLVSLGGTVGSGSYTFGAQQGLSLSNALPNPADYSILMNFEFSTPSTSYEKIVDFQNLTADAGLYDLNAALTFYPTGNLGTTPMPTGTFVNVAITRDAASTILTGYVNGVFQWSFTDTPSWGIFSSANNIINFFQDDTVTNGNESSAGVATRIQIFNGALTAAEVATLSSSNVPEPMSLGLAGVGVSLCLLLRSRRNRIGS